MKIFLLFAFAISTLINFTLYGVIVRTPFLGRAVIERIDRDNKILAKVYVIGGYKMTEIEALRNIGLNLIKETSQHAGRDQFGSFMEINYYLTPIILGLFFLTFFIPSRMKAKYTSKYTIDDQGKPVIDQEDSGKVSSDS